MTPETEFSFDTDFSFNDDFSFQLEEKEDIGEELPEDLEEAVSAEISEALRLFKERAKKEAEEKQKNTSTDYWFAVYFATQEDRDKFLQVYDLIDKLNSQYLSGEELIDALGTPIQLSKITPPKPFRKPKGIEDLTMDF
jgi:hypothetical protein